MNDSPIGLSHSVTGIIARFVAVGVCIIGVILAVVRMPKSVRPFVRWSHGIVGILLSIYGPIVVWNGWVRIAITTDSPLDTTPVIWLSVSIALVLAYAGGLVYKRMRPLDEKCEDVDGSTISESDEPGDIEKSIPLMSLSQVLDIVRDKEYFLFNVTEVVILDPEFQHPGGNTVLSQYNGKDITGVFGGTEIFEDGDRKRAWTHSVVALNRLRDMRVCMIDLMGDGSSTIGTCGAPGAFSIDDTSWSKTVGIIVGKLYVTKSVIQLQIKVMDILMFGLVELGSKIKLSLQYGEEAVERTYTIAEIFEPERIIYLYIKIYDSGELTPSIAKVDDHDSVFLSGLVAPVKIPVDDDGLLLLAAGTGIIPMISYIKASVADSHGVHVMWWLHDADDVFLCEVLSALMDMGVTVDIFFTHPREGDDVVVSGMLVGLNVRQGRINEDMVTAAASGRHPTVVMSGPPGFISAGSSAILTAGLGEKFFCLD